MKKLVWIALLSWVSHVSLAQKAFNEGTITFAATWTGGDNVPAEMVDAFPKEITTYYKDGKSFSGMEINLMGQTMKMNVVMETTPMKMTMLMDMMGQKIGIVSSEEDMKSIMDTIQISYEYLDFKKQIAGYNCQKVIAKMGSGQTMELFVTKELVMPQSQYTMTFKGLQGTPLEFTQKQNGLTVKMVASSIKEAKVDTSKFTIPEGYMMMTMKEAAAMGLN